MVGTVLRARAPPSDQRLIGGSARLTCRGGGGAQVCPCPTAAISSVDEAHTVALITTPRGKRRPPPGFLNLGNTCYANAALQCLFSTALSRALLEPRCFPVFRQYSSNSHLLMLAEEDDSYDVISGPTHKVNAHNKESYSSKRELPPAATTLITGDKQNRRHMSELCQWITGELTDLCRKYRKKNVPHSPAAGSTHENNDQVSSIVSKVFWSKPPRSPRNVVDPGNITRHVNRLSNCLRFGRQEDSHEFLRSLLSAITMDGNNKELSSLFDGLLESSVRCQQCGNASITRDRYMDLSLEIGHNEIKTLYDALEHYTRVEILSGDNMVYCNACKRRQSSAKALRLATSPSILVCHLKRFDYDAYGRVRRLNKEVSFSPKLDISSFMSSENKSIPPTYELVAFVSHQGRTCSSGHYIAYVRGSTGTTNVKARPWYRVSDNEVQEVELDTVLKKEAYILMYEVEGMRHHNIDGDCGSVESLSCRKNVDDCHISSPLLHNNIEVPAAASSIQNNVVLDIFYQCGLVDFSEDALGLCFSTAKESPTRGDNINCPEVRIPESTNGENKVYNIPTQEDASTTRGRQIENVMSSPGRKERKGRSLSSTRMKRREPVAILARSTSTVNPNGTGLVRSSCVSRHI